MNPNTHLSLDENQFQAIINQDSMSQIRSAGSLVELEGGAVGLTSGPISGDVAKLVLNNIENDEDESAYNP